MPQGKLATHNNVDLTLFQAMPSGAISTESEHQQSYHEKTYLKLT